MGSPVGMNVGFKLGCVEGFEVGAKVTLSSVGFALGALVGSIEGFKLGLDVGDPLGVELG